MNTGDTTQPEFGGDDFVSSVTQGSAQQTGNAAADDAGGQGSASSSAASPSKLEAAMAELASTVKGIAQPKPEAKAPSQDEINEYWGVWNPSKENPNFVREFFNLPEDADPKHVEAANARFAAMQKGLVRQAVIGAQRLIEKFQQEHFGPVKKFYEQEQARGLKTRFETAYPDLADAKYSKLLTAFAESLADQNFNSEEEYFKALAEGAAGEIAKLVPGFVLGQKKQTKSAATTPRLPRTSVGGTGGTGSGALDMLKHNGDLAGELFG